MKLNTRIQLSSETNNNTSENAHRILNAASYLGAITGIVAGYSSAYLVTAIEVMDRQLGQNQIPDKMSVYTAVTSLVVGGMSSTLLKQLNKRHHTT